jgi:hypothetical protein
MAEGAGEDVGGEQVESSDILAPGEAATPEPKAPVKVSPIPDWKFAKPEKNIRDLAIDSVIEDSKSETRVARKTSDDSIIPNKPGEGVERPRDESGRFITSGKVEADASLVETPTPQAPKPPTDTPKQAALKFADREFEDLTQAEKAFRDIEWHANQAAKSAQEWKAYAESLKAGGQAAPAPTPEPSKGNTLPTFDAEQAAIVKELAIEAGKPELYDKWVLEEQERVFNARLDARLNELQAPIQQQQAQAQLHSAITNTWSSLRQYTKPDGSPTFPEVGNGQVEQQIGEYWVALGLPPEAMLNPASAMAAIGLYRLMSEGQNAPTPTPPTPSLPPPPTDGESIVAGNGRNYPLGEEHSDPSVRYLTNALNRSGYRIKGANGQSVHLFDR